MSNILLVSATKLEHHDEELFGIPIHIIGVGKVNAAVNTLKLIQKYKPTHVVNFGSCGNLKDYEVGDVIPVGEVYDDFFGCVVPEHEPIRISDSTFKLFTTDSFYDFQENYHFSYENNIRDCDLVDMEGYSIAKVCKQENISVSLYKWVSDDGSHNDWLANAAAGYNNFKKLFKKKYMSDSIKKWHEMQEEKELLTQSSTGEGTFIYESPDGGDTVTRRPFGSDIDERETIKFTPKLSEDQIKEAYKVLAYYDAEVILHAAEIIEKDKDIL